MQLFSQHEIDITGLLPENFLVIARSYSGNADLATDKAAADAVLAAAFPNRHLEVANVNASANTATLTGAAYSTLLSPFVYKNGVLLASDAYTANPATGVLSAFNVPLIGGDSVKATLADFLPGVDTIDPKADTPSKMDETKGFGTIDYIYRTMTYDTAKFSLSIKGAFDVKSKRRSYANQQLEKSLYGASWNAPGTPNELKRNTDPIVVALIWWMPDAITGDVVTKKVIWYGGTLQSPVFPKAVMGKPAAYDIAIECLYAFEETALKQA